MAAAGLPGTFAGLRRLIHCGHADDGEGVAGGAFLVARGEAVEGHFVDALSEQQIDDRDTRPKEADAEAAEQPLDEQGATGGQSLGGPFTSCGGRGDAERDRQCPTHCQ